MGKIALLFAGQGAQYPGMGRAIIEENPAAAAVFARLTEQRPDLPALCFTSEPEELVKTVNTQPCLFAVELAIAEAVRASGIDVGAVAGFSLGEIPALTFAGYLSQEQGFALVQKRAQAMDQAAAEHPGAMAAVLKLTVAQVEELCSSYSQLYPVNYNSVSQTVVAGQTEQLDSLAQQVKELGGRVMPLAVSGAFHSPCMDSAAQVLAEYLEQLTLDQGQLLVYANGTAKPYVQEKVKATIAQQVNHPVRWQQTIEQLWQDGYTVFIEIGPGKTLTNLAKKIIPTAITYHVETPEELAALQEINLNNTPSGV